jgi:pimeloyl-ACP methyl ester carboxylesterase
MLTSARRPVIFLFIVPPFRYLYNEYNMPVPTPATSIGQLTAPNLDIAAANGVTYAYRRFGNTESGAPPLLFLQHFRGNLDNWDPMLVDRLAATREVILLDNRGVGGSTGVVPDNVTDMARDAGAFIDAVGLACIDVLGFSLGGFVAQELALLRPRVVRRLILAGTGPRGGYNMHQWRDDALAASHSDETTGEQLLYLFFSPSEASKAKGMEFLGRIFARTKDRDKPTSLAARDAQSLAITEWGIPDPSRLDRLTGITQPTFVANGDNDIMLQTRNTLLLAERLPNAQLRIYSDANHAFLFQYAELFGDHVNAFLDK